MLFSYKKSETKWFEVLVSSLKCEQFALVDSYHVLLRNLKRYPYAYETIAQLSNPVVTNDGSICFNLCPTTYSLSKRKQLFSPRNWGLQLRTDDSEQVKRAYATGWINTLRFQEAESGQEVDFFITTDSIHLDERMQCKQIFLTGPFLPPKEIVPPWVMAPDAPPEDGFWRQSGSDWLFYVWMPYWKSLSLDLKQNYLELWRAPDVWCYRLLPRNYIERSELHLER